MADFRPERLKAEMQIPRESEKKSALIATRAMRPNSPRVIPPISRARQNRQNRENAIEGVDGIRAHFADDDVVSFQVGEEKEAERALALFAAETIGSIAYAAQVSGESRATCKHAEENLGNSLRRFILHHQEKPRADNHDCKRSAGANPVGDPAARGDTQFRARMGRKVMAG